MIVNCGNLAFVLAELDASIKGGQLAMPFSALAIADELVSTGRHADVLTGVSKWFSAILHDIENVRTLFLQMEMMLSIPDIQEKMLCQILATHVEQFHAYIQGILDYAAEGMFLLFPTKDKRRNFAALADWAATSCSDSVESQLKEIVLHCDKWAVPFRNLRNCMMHRAAEVRVSRSVHEDGFQFIVFDSDEQLLLNESLLHAKVFSRQMPKYANFESYAGVVLGRLIYFLNRVARVLQFKLAELTGVDSFALNLALPTNMALVVHSIELACARLKGTSFDLLPMPAAYEARGSKPTPANIVILIGNAMWEAQCYASPNGKRNLFLQLEALIELFSTKEPSPMVPWDRDQSIYSLKATCALRRFARDERRCLTELLRILNWLRTDIHNGKVASFGLMGMGSSLDFVPTLIAPFPAHSISDLFS
jgi:hypothetical protein